MAKKKVEKVKEEDVCKCDTCNNPECQPKTRALNGECLCE
jgi:hypothetical protein